MERDIVERLREMSGPIVPNLVTEAADEIERLRRGGCARDQRITQYCAEAVRLQAERDEAADTIKRLRGMVEELQVHADDLSANPTEERLMIETLTAERDEARYMLNLERRERRSIRRGGPQVSTEEQWDMNFLAHLRKDIADGTDGKVYSAEFVADIMAAVDRVIAERDYARRGICNLLSWEDHHDKFCGSPAEYAKQRGWDCFKEDAK